MLDVAHLLRAHLCLRDGVARLLEPRLDLDLLARARPQLGGGLLPDGLVGGELLGEGVAPGRDRLGGALQRVRGALGVAGERAAARAARTQPHQPQLPLGALVLRALGEPALGAQVRLDARPLDGGLAILRRGPAQLDPARRAAQELVGLVERTRGLAHLGVRVLAPLESVR